LPATAAIVPHQPDLTARGVNSSRR
jgi:hypothetical protein